MMWGFGYLLVLSQNTMWNNILVGVIQLVLWVGIKLLLVIVMVKVVCVLVPYILPPRTMIFWFMVAIFHLRVIIIHLWLVKTNTGPFICYLLVGIVILVFLVMVCVVLVLWKPTSPPRKFIFLQTGMFGGNSISDLLYRIPHGFIVNLGLFR